MLLNPNGANSFGARYGSSMVPASAGLRASWDGGAPRTTDTPPDGGNAVPANEAGFGEEATPDTVGSTLAFIATRAALAALAEDKDDLEALTFTAGGATGPEVEALRDAISDVVEDVHALENSLKVASLVSVGG